MSSSTPARIDLTENVFKHISDNSNPNLNPSPDSKPKGQKPLRENEMMSYFRQVPRYRKNAIFDVVTI